MRALGMSHRLVFACAHDDVYAQRSCSVQIMTARVIELSLPH